MTFHDAIQRLSQAANALLALSLLLALVHFRWSLELFAAGIATHAAAVLAAQLSHTSDEPTAEQLA